MLVLVGRGVIGGEGRWAWEEGNLQHSPIDMSPDAVRGRATP